VSRRDVVEVVPKLSLLHRISVSELDQDLDRLALVHRAVAIGHSVEVRDRSKTRAGSIRPSRTSGWSSSMSARAGDGPPRMVTFLKKVVNVVGIESCCGRPPRQAELNAKRGLVKLWCSHT
jgi:hypothetical protein